MRTSASGESALLLLDVVQVLSKEQVDYAIVGAMAASVYGVIRASRDADALLSISVPALAGLERTFRAAGFHTELRRGDFDDPIGAVLTLQDSFDNQVDLLVGIRGFDHPAHSPYSMLPRGARTGVTPALACIKASFLLPTDAKAPLSQGFRCSGDRSDSNLWDE